MADRKVLELTGTGKVFDDVEPVSDVRYHLVVYRTYIESHTLGGGSSAIPGLLRTEGTITVKGKSLRVTTRKMKLVTEEGYSQDFYVADSYGAICATGPLLDSGGEPVIR